MSSGRKEFNTYQETLNVEKSNSSTLCEWFNKKPNSNINNILDILNSYIT